MSYTIKLQSAPEETATYWIETALDREGIEELIKSENKPELYFHEVAEKVREHDKVGKVVRVDVEDFTVKIK